MSDDDDEQHAQDHHHDVAVLEEDVRDVERLEHHAAGRELEQDQAQQQCGEHRERTEVADREAREPRD